jgi:diguanylate cyclase (GGDEF)-like protein
MQWSIRNKLILGGGVILGTVAVSAYFASEQTRLVAASLKRSTTIEAPLKEAGLEMEINLLGTGFAVLAYLDDNAPAHLTRIRDDGEDFARYLLQYETLAYAPRLQEIGRKAKEGFEQFRALGDGLIRTHDEQSRKMNETLTMFRILDTLIGEKILPGKGPNSPLSGDKRDAANMMRISLHDFERNLVGLREAVDGEWEARSSQLALSFLDHRKRYLRNALSLQERNAIGEVERDFITLRKNIEEIFTLSRSQRLAIAEFVQLRQTMDNLLDDELQLAAGAEVEAAEKRLFEAIEWLNAMLIGLLLGGITLGTAVGVAVYRGVAGPVKRLGAMTQALAQGKIIEPGQLEANDEFGELIRSFGDMALARTRAEGQIRSLNIELEERVELRTLELDRTNRALEQHNRDADQITKLTNLLQTADNMTEGGEILGRLLPPLLAPHGGVIYLNSNSLDRLDCLAQWGKVSQVPTIYPIDCWGVRRGGPYGASDRAQDVVCPHVAAETRQQPYLCVPLTAQNTSIGLLHVSFAADSLPVQNQETERAKVFRVADQLALALANLKLRQTLREQSIRDPLTGLHNRRYCEESLNREISRAVRDGQPVVVVMVDIDKFKSYNDQYGHDGGDAVLRALARLMKDSARAGDIVSRYGGEEFAILLHATPLSGAIVWSEKLRVGARQMEIKYAGELLPPVTISVGIALHPEHGTSAAEVIHAADVALYEAKNGGRDRVAIARPLTEPSNRPSS